MHDDTTRRRSAATAPGLGKPNERSAQAEVTESVITEHLEGFSICLDDLDEVDAASAVTKPSAGPSAHQELPALGKYRDLGPLGKGGMGEVRRILDPVLNRTLAMKIIHPDSLRSEELVARFVEEVQVGSQLQHPNIIPVHELGVLDDGRAYFTMKEIKGREFAEAIKAVHQASKDGRWRASEDGWTFARLIEVFRQVCSAMAFVHSRGVIHRDLKPANVMIGRFDEVLIVDWGLAKVIGRPDDAVETFESVTTERSENKALQTRIGAVAGTPSYMSPEQAAGQIDELDERSDIYALGAILYHILAGRPPFEGDGGQKILQPVLGTSPATLRRRVELDFQPGKITLSGDLDFTGLSDPPLPDELVDACEKAMSHAKEDRFQSAQELSHALKQWIDGSKKRERANAWVDRARAAADETELTKRKIAVTESRVEAAKEALPKDAEIEQRFALWDLEEELIALRDHVTELEGERQRVLQRALIECPDSRPALEELTLDCIKRHQRAAHQRDQGAMRVLANQALNYLQSLPEDSKARQDGARYFAGEAQVRVTLPSAATVTLERFEEVRKRLVPQPVDSIEAATFDRTLPVGSYQLRLEAPGCDPVTYPFTLGYGADWPTNPPQYFGAPRTLTLPEAGATGDGFCYVPEGWFSAGGDDLAPNALPGVRAWVDGFIMSETPITHEQYLEFINALVESSGRDEARLWLPREQAGADGEIGRSLYTWREDHYTYLDGVAKQRHPVTNITWYCAVAYTRWRSQVSGERWRLPLELEWEKAARGVDGRRFPWGDRFDAALCVMMDSHAGEPEIQAVDHNPFDQSLYGVRCMAGNTREWCLDRFDAERYGLDQGRLQMPTADELAETGFRSSRGGSYGNGANRTRCADRDWWFPHLSYVGRGFRIVRSYPQTPESDALHERIERAYEAAAQARRDRYAKR
ncbi:MAG: bifunctional serine/threonine-protein kinase/formylglycine-generating enzyme family protein [Myxococcota bacterium]|nr:bifunctional serine/threonine-protein kinase/formylglycine-generating enzyme family protein [Myxococcota bacterium]